MPALSITVRVGFATLSGLLLFVAFPGVGFWPLGFVALVPYLLAQNDQSFRAAASLGWVMGFVSGALGYGWLPSSVGRFLDWSWTESALLGVAVWAFQAGRWAVFGLLLTLLKRSASVHELLSVLTAFAISELYYPMLFPYALSGTLWRVPELLQTAEWGGQVAVAIPMVAFNWSLARLARERSVLAFVRPGVIAGLLLPVAAWGYGKVRLRAVDLELQRSALVAVGVVQTAATPEGGYEKGNSAVRSIREHQFLSRQYVLDKAPSLVIWGETALGSIHNVSSSSFGRRYGIVPFDGSQILVGARVMQQGSGSSDSSEVTNSALLIGARGDLVARYDKQVLIPLIEWIPHWARGYFEKRSYVSGFPRSMVPIGEHSASVFICYEALNADYVRRLANDGATELLINIADDSWFGRSFEAEQHLALTQLRAVENRRYLLRAASGGQSAIIDPAGRVLQLAPAYQGVALLAEVHWMTLSTWFQRWGQLPWAILAVAIVGYSSLIQRYRRNHPSQG